MKTELQKKLLDKYFSFFPRDQKIYVGEKPVIEEIHELFKQKEMVTPIQFGFECSDGWYMLLDELMGEIKNHIENENRNRDNQIRSKILYSISQYLRIRLPYKRKLLRNLGTWIHDVAPKGVPHLQFQITQIKEKFGGLRFYYDGGDRDIFGMTRLAESLSYAICETCGSTKDVGRTQGWYYTICKPCYDKDDRANKLIWKPNE